MKTLSRSMIILLAVSIIAGSAVSDAFGQSKIQEITRRMDEHSKGLSTLRTKVTMVKTSAQLGESETSVGSALYGRQDGKDALVRIDWQRPAESLSVIDGEYTIYRPRLEMAYKGSVKGASKDTKTNSLLSFMNMSKAQLNANYTIRLLAENASLSNGAKTWHLELVPKTTMSYKTAELWVDVDGMPQQTKIIEKNNDSSTVLLSNLEKNIKLNKSNFIIELPKGTKIERK